MKNPLAIANERADVAVPCIEKVHFINVVRPRAQFKRTNLQNSEENTVKLCQYLLDDEDHVTVGSVSRHYRPILDRLSADISVEYRPSVDTSADMHGCNLTDTRPIPY